MAYPIFIICRDRLSSLKDLISWLELVGEDEIYLVDNESAYLPLLEFYETTPHKVIRLGGNWGHHSPWSQGLIERYAGDRSFVVTDPDIVPIEECPHDAMEIFRTSLERYYDRTKCGFSLKIDDLPDHYQFKNNVVRWESQFWTNERTAGLHLTYAVAVDTTFALYRPGAGPGISEGLRTAYPYTARHTTWYINSADPPEEFVFYRDRASEVSQWTGHTLPRGIT